MYSLNSLKTFFKINVSLISYSFMEYFIDTNNSYFSSFLLQLFRNYLFIDVINHILKDKEYIDKNKRIFPKETFFKEFDLYLITTVIVETIGNCFIKNNIIQEKNIYSTDIIYYIPISFCFELIFDLFHYNIHIIMHNKYLYKYFHKTHHKFKYPSAITTFYQHPIDIFVSTTIPTIFTIYFINGFYTISFFTFKMLSVYKTFIEISGHVGKIHNSSSFTQFVWLPKLLAIELKTEDHDLHHSLNNCNYSKRFCLWDKIFGTYINYKSKLK